MAMLLPDRALAIQTGWLGSILAGTKTIEIRSTDHNFEDHLIYLLETKTGWVRGTARLGAARALAEQELSENREALEVLDYRRPRAWPLTEVAALETPWPISAQARKYCPTWVPRHRWEKYPVAPAVAATSGRDDAASSLKTGLLRGRAQPSLSLPVTAASPGAGQKRPRRAETDAAAARVARKRPSATDAFVLRSEDEEEDVEEAEDAVNARWDHARLKDALDTLADAISSGTDDALPLQVAQLQALAAGIPEAVLRLAALEGMPEALKQLMTTPTREKTMPLLQALQRAAAAAASSRRDEAASAVAEVPATIPDVEAVGKLIIRRLAALDATAEGTKDDEGFDVWEEDTISDVVERVFGTLGLDGSLADFYFRRVVFEKEGDTMVSKLIRVEGTFNAVGAREVVLCKKGG